jgi:GT2 family glycosyltransferase
VASGRFLSFFDADDVMLPGTLRAAVEYLESFPEASMVLVDYRNFSSDGQSPTTHFDSCPEMLAATGLALGVGRALLPPGEVSRLLLAENFTIADTALIRYEAFRATGGFDEALVPSEDFDLIYRVARAGSVGILARVGCLRRRHSGNLSGQTLRALRSKIKSREKIRALENDGHVRRRLDRSLARLQIAYARALNERGLLGGVGRWIAGASKDPRVAVREWRALAKAVVVACSAWLRRR